MYTGTLIQDLIGTVERAEGQFERKQIADWCELERLYRLSDPALECEHSLAGAA